MTILQTEKLDLFLMEDTLWVLNKTINIPSYDFDFQRYFRCQHLPELPDSRVVVSRAGPRVYYPQFYNDLLSDGVRLIHDPATHLLCSELPQWYPLITEFTPRSLWFDEIPDAEILMAHFEWPIFVKGARQTSRHSKRLSIIEGPEDYAHMQQAYMQDRILHHQQFVCREFVPLRKVADVEGDVIPASFEFRTFWWRGQFVGSGRYWVNAPAYRWTESEKADALAVAGQVAAALPVPFLVVDVGQQTDGRWIVIEVNDGQDSGYAEMPAVQLWQNILAAERAHLDASQYSNEGL
ncbi:MAG: ATP-grasp domain-containing protein [Phototrophicaceae bacterium]|jgi:hypothetical protein